MSKYKIVCVDDEVEILDIYQAMLGHLDYEIVVFSSCLKALDYIKKNSRNIIYIFSDYQMPEMDGIDFRKCINELGEDIPFSIITAFYDLEMAKDGMKYQISAFVKKPFQAIDFTNLLADLGQKRKTYLDDEMEMVNSFIEESYPMLEDIEELIMSLESDPTNTVLLNTYFRLLHTIKGTASCVGLKNLPKFTHVYEELVVKLQEKQIDLTPEVANALLKGLDQLKFMYAEAKNGRLEIDIEEALSIFDTDKFSHYTEDASNKKVKSAGKSADNNETQKITEEKIAVSVKVLDNFMELSGQFTVLRNTLIKSAIVLEQRYHGDSDVEIVRDSLVEMHKVISVLQNDIAEMRKVSLENIYKPLRRVVRDASSQLGKEIDFKVVGEELRVDTFLGKALANSLVHMVRNSIDHGIELPANRVLAGKSKTGQIHLKSFQDGENIIIELSDDGNGLSLSRIKTKAIEKNLFSEEQLGQMSDSKIFAIIFHSGFSTAQQVTSISGRGVGMDMVKSSIESAGGKIVITSTEGKGTCFTMTLPIPRSVLIIKSLMIQSSESTFSIPMGEVAEVVRLQDYKESKVLHNVEEKLIFSHHDELLPLVDLNQLLYKKKHYDQSEVMNIVIVKGEGYKFGIIVDEILDIEEIVVKKMSKQFKDATCFMGVTFIGHGELALILDLASIAETCHIKYVDAESNVASNAQTDAMEFIQFNLKKSKHYALPLEVVNRLEEVSSSEVEYCGNIPLVRYCGEPMPLLFIERQLDLCSQTENLIQIYPELLTVIVVNFHNKCFGIVVDEILDIGSTHEGLDSQNVDRLGFIGTTFITDKTVTILDAHFLVDNYIKFEKELSKKQETKIVEDTTWHYKDQAA